MNCDYDVLLLALLPEVFWHHYRNDEGHYIYRINEWGGMVIPPNYRECPPDSIEQIEKDRLEVISRIPPKVKIIAPLYEYVPARNSMERKFQQKRGARLEEINDLLKRTKRVHAITPRRGYGKSSPDGSEIHYDVTVYGSFVKVIREILNETT